MSMHQPVDSEETTTNGVYALTWDVGGTKATTVRQAGNPEAWITYCGHSDKTQELTEVSQ